MPYVPPVDRPARPEKGAAASVGQSPEPRASSSTEGSGSRRTGQVGGADVEGEPLAPRASVGGVVVLSEQVVRLSGRWHRWLRRRQREAPEGRERRRRRRRRARRVRIGHDALVLAHDDCWDAGVSGLLGCGRRRLALPCHRCLSAGRDLPTQGARAVCAPQFFLTQVSLLNSTETRF